MAAPRTTRVHLLAAPGALARAAAHRQEPPRSFRALLAQESRVDHCCARCLRCPSVTSGAALARCPFLSPPRQQAVTSAALARAAASHAWVRGSLRASRAMAAARAGGGAPRAPRRLGARLGCLAVLACALLARADAQTASATATASASATATDSATPTGTASQTSTAVRWRGVKGARRAAARRQGGGCWRLPLAFVPAPHLSQSEPACHAAPSPCASPLSPAALVRPARRAARPRRRARRARAAARVAARRPSRAARPPRRASRRR